MVVELLRCQVRHLRLAARVLSSLANLARSGQLPLDATAKVAFGEFAQHLGHSAAILTAASTALSRSGAQRRATDPNLPTKRWLAWASHRPPEEALQPMDAELSQSARHMTDLLGTLAEVGMLHEATLAAWLELRARAVTERSANRRDARQEPGSAARAQDAAQMAILFFASAAAVFTELLAAEAAVATTFERLTYDEHEPTLDAGARRKLRGAAPGETTPLLATVTVVDGTKPNAAARREAVAP